MTAKAGWPQCLLQLLFSQRKVKPKVSLLLARDTASHWFSDNVTGGPIQLLNACLYITWSTVSSAEMGKHWLKESRKQIWIRHVMFKVGARSDFQALLCRKVIGCWHPRTHSRCWSGKKNSTETSCASCLMALWNVDAQTGRSLRRNQRSAKPGAHVRSCWILEIGKVECMQTGTKHSTQCSTSRHALSSSSPSRAVISSRKTKSGSVRSSSNSVFEKKRGPSVIKKGHWDHGFERRHALLLRPGKRAHTAPHFWSSSRQSEM